MFRRRYRKRFKRRAYRKRGGSLWNLAKKAASGVVKYYLNPEYKFLDYTNTSSPSASGLVIPLAILTQGDQNTMRSGNEIKITSFLMRGTILKNNVAGNTKLRMIVFSDLSSNGATPAVADVLQTANQDSPLNRVNGTRFKVWADQSWLLDDDDAMKSIYLFQKKQHHVHYLTGDNTTASQGQGFPYVLFISNENTNFPQVSINSRMRFLDN